MSEKKHEARFNIYLCLSDPRHKIAADALNGAGRRKSYLVADAICYYLERQGMHFAGKVDEAIESNNVVQADLTLKAINQNANKQEMDKEMRSAILEGLNMFGGND